MITIMKMVSRTRTKKALTAGAYPGFCMSPVPIYTPGWRETMWGKVPC